MLAFLAALLHLLIDVSLVLASLAAVVVATIFALSFPVEPELVASILIIGVLAAFGGARIRAGKSEGKGVPTPQISDRASDDAVVAPETSSLSSGSRPHVGPVQAVR